MGAAKTSSALAVSVGLLLLGTAAFAEEEWVSKEVQAGPLTIRQVQKGINILSDGYASAAAKIEAALAAVKSGKLSVNSERERHCSGG